MSETRRERLERIGGTSGPQRDSDIDWLFNVARRAIEAEEAGVLAQAVGILGHGADVENFRALREAVQG